MSHDGRPPEDGPTVRVDRHGQDSGRGQLRPATDQHVATAHTHRDDRVHRPEQVATATGTLSHADTTFKEALV